MLAYISLISHGDSDLPVILWWYKGIYPHENEETTVIRCGHSKCLSTKSKEYLKTNGTVVIVFYGSRLSPDDLPLPRKRNHEWAIFHEESPMNNFMLSHGVFQELFNHSATFSRDSDYPLTTDSIYSLKYLTDRKPFPLHLKNQMMEEAKLAPILYVQSHKNVPSDRDSYVQELMKHIAVDSYGKCLHNKNLPSDLADPHVFIPKWQIFRIYFSLQIPHSFRKCDLQWLHDRKTNASFTCWIGTYISWLVSSSRLDARQ